MQVYPRLDREFRHTVQSRTVGDRYEVVDAIETNRFAYLSVDPGGSALKRGCMSVTTGVRTRRACSFVKRPIANGSWVSGPDRGCDQEGQDRGKNEGDKRCGQVNQFF